MVGALGPTAAQQPQRTASETNATQVEPQKGQGLSFILTWVVWFCERNSSEAALVKLRAPPCRHSPLNAGDLSM